jgi:hypothetical protein
MSLSQIPLILALIWLILANVLGALPSQDNHWRRAYALILAGAPLILWLFIAQGWFLTLLFLVCAASVLRWPLRRAVRWLRGRMTFG